MNIRFSRWLRLWQCFMCLYIVALPFAWSAQPSAWLRFLSSTGNDHLSDRLSIYNFSVDAIDKHWFGGYGFGGAASVLAGLSTLNGGHPHNIVFLFWLELGIFGALLLALATIVLLSFINQRTAGRRNEPVVWALFIFGVVIFSLSFDIWLPGVVLTYAMWLSMIVFSCQADSFRRAD